MKKCDTCGKERRNVSLQPSSSQLIFGGFPVRHENRCLDCERKLSKQLDKILDNLTKDCQS